MAYTNLPPNLQDMFTNLTGRISRLEYGPKDLTEAINITGTAATGTLNIDVDTAGIWYYNSNASANFTLNIRGDSTISLNNYMNVNESLTVVILIKNGSTARYATTYQIDGTGVTPLWYPAAPSAGTANATDAYTLTIVKTANAAYTVFGTLVSFV